jgi:hypothetical protein
MDLAAEFDLLIAAIEERGIPYALAGGLAVAVWGAPRATTDIDLLARPSDVPALLGVAAERGFTLAALPMRFRDGMDVQRVTKIEAGESLTLDLLLVNDTLQPVWDGRVRLPREGGEMSVVSREGLIQMKLSAGRPQDIVDVDNLREADR